MKSCLLVIVFISCAVALYGQQPTEDLELELESIAEGSEDAETDFVQLAEYWELLQQNPVLVNFATTDDLERLPFFDVFQVSNLLRYRQETGPIYSPYELMAVKGFDREFIEQITPFLDFAIERERPELKLKNIARYSRHNLMMRTDRVFPLRDGFRAEPEPTYLGGPYQAYMRYRGQYRDLLSVGLVTQHDAGEPWGGPQQPYGMDHWSFHLALQNYGRLRTLILGDFQAEFGQGLALWTGLAFGKSAQVTDIKRYPRGFRPFTGSEENRYLRGIAASYRLSEQWDISVFFSRKGQDANAQVSDSSATPDFVSSLQTTGLHRTPNELANKNANTLTIYGAHADFRYRNLRLGASGFHYQLALPLHRPGRLYQRWLFDGDRLSQLSVDFNYIYRRVNAFGELATDHLGNPALALGMQTDLADGLLLSLQHRYLHPEYQFIYNAPFSENGNYGEQGTYLGLRWLLGPAVTLRAYADIYQFAWLRFRTDAPSEGQEVLAQLDLRLGRNLTGYLRYRQETDQINAPEQGHEPQLAGRLRQLWRFHLAYRITREWTSAFRAEKSFYRLADESSQGMVLFHDLKYRPEEKPLSLSFRLALIGTEDYNSRIYAYEHDVTYAFSIPPYYGRALRSYLLVGYDFSDRLRLQGRYAITAFADRDEVSSGPQRVEGSQISDAKLLLRWKF